LSKGDIQREGVVIRRKGARVLRWVLAVVFLPSILSWSGCKSPTDYRREADATAYNIVKEKQLEALGKTEGFTIVRYSDLLRYRLMEAQGLQYSHEASLGSHRAPPVEHWPDPNYLVGVSSKDDGAQLDPLEVLEDEGPIKISLNDALMIGAQNSFSYQTLKEAVFAAAIDLDYQRHFFERQYSQEAGSTFTNDNSTTPATNRVDSYSDIGLTRNFASGASFAASLALDIVNLLSSGGASSMGLTMDASVSVPLLRGSGRHIVTEPLTQAERDVVYAIYDFEENRRGYAVDIAGEYMGVLSAMNRIENAEENYRRLVISVRRSRRLADSGSLTEIEVDQAVQEQLSAREGWIAAMESYQNALDNLKITLGLPVDADIELDQSELDRMVGVSTSVLVDLDSSANQTEPNLPADAPITFEKPGWQKPGPLEIDTESAVKLAFGNRLDLRKSQAAVYDAQREVIILADQFRGELTLGAGYNVDSSSYEDARLRFDQAAWRLPLTLNLPFERTRERNNYRMSLVRFESTCRSLALLEDTIKRDVRRTLRNMLATRENLQIQAKGMVVAKKRVESTDLFLLAGRAQIRDVLEAQRSLLGAQNSLTSAVVSYRIAELTLQDQMGVLEVDERGLWREFSPEDSK